MADHDTLISEFCDLTESEPDQARHYLEASKWDINTAINQYFGGDNANDETDSVEDIEDSDPPAPPIASGGSSSTTHKNNPGNSRSSKFASLSDFRTEEVDSDSDGGKKQKDFFAGGEKSGLAIKDPGKRNSKDLIHNILNIARGEAEGRQGRGEVEARQSRSHFTGVGQTLGSDDSPSIVIPDTTPQAAEVVQRNLTFWSNGFSIEDGPLMRYDDPNNQEILTAIQSGTAPTAVMGVRQGQRADVHVFKRLDEEYVPPKKKTQHFAGQGNRLGSPTPEVSAAPPPAAVPIPQVSPVGPAPPTPLVNVDATQAVTSLQIRLGDGTRLICPFNYTHTVGDIYSFVNSSSLASRSRNYVLQTTFPNKELMDHSLTLSDAGLVNAVVVQKWC